MLVLERHGDRLLVRRKCDIQVAGDIRAGNGEGSGAGNGRSLLLGAASHSVLHGVSIAGAGLIRGDRADIVFAIGRRRVAGQTFALRNRESLLHEGRGDLDVSRGHREGILAVRQRDLHGSIRRHALRLIAGIRNRCQRHGVAHLCGRRCLELAVRDCAVDRNCVVHFREVCGDRHSFARHRELVVRDRDTRRGDRPLLKFVAGLRRGSQRDLRAGDCRDGRCARGALILVIADGDGVCLRLSDLDCARCCLTARQKVLRRLGLVLVIPHDPGD